MNPKISIIMPFLDPTPEFFEEAIGSVMEQTYPHWELILVDDGSGPAALSVAERFVAEDPGRIRLTSSAEDQPAGVSVARNVGIELAEGEFIATLDADDVFLPDRLASHVAPLVDNPGVAVVVGDTEWWFSWRDPPEKGDEHRSAGIRPGIVEAPRYLTRILHRRAEEPGTCSMTMRRSVVEEIGGFEPEWTGLYEDQVFFAKFFSNCPIYYLPGVCARYRRHAGSLSRSCDCAEALKLRPVFIRWVEDYARMHVAPRRREQVLAACRRGHWFLDHPRAATATRQFWKACRRVRAFTRR